MQEEPNQPEANQFMASTNADPYGYEPMVDSPAPADTITWTASEYIAHHKSPRWYAMLGLAAVIIALIVWAATRDTISALVVLVGAGVLGGYGARQPRELQYRLDVDSLTIGGKNYDLNAFRSFTVDDQQAIACVNLMPLKRFAPGLSIYFDPSNEDSIIEILALRLPLEDHQPDLLDRLMRHIRF